MKKTVRKKILIFTILFCAANMPVFTIRAKAEVCGTNRIHFIALTGHSDAILLESNGRFGMIDSGEDTDYPDGTDPRYPLRSGIVTTGGHEEDVIEYMKSVGVTKENFEFYLGTHPHSDHIGSADEIIREFEPDRVYIMEYSDSYISSSSNLWDNLYVYDKMIEAAREVGAVLIQNFDVNAPSIPGENPEVTPDPTETPEPTETPDPTETPESTGEETLESICSQSETVSCTAQEGSVTANPRFSLGEMQLEVVNYGDDYKTAQKPDANYFSLGVIVEVNGYRAFLSGDINNYDGDESRLAPYIGKVDILKMGHHGLYESNTPEYLYTLSPDYAVVMGLFNSCYNNTITMNAVNQLAETNGTRIYFTRDFAKSEEAKSIIFMLDDPDGVKTDFPSDLLQFYSCDAAEYYYCFKDGYQFPYTGTILRDGWYYFFENSECSTGYEREIPFTDVAYHTWYEDYIRYVYQRGIMTGLNEKTFGLEEQLSRAQFAVILYRMENSPETSYTGRFPDVEDNIWYTDAIMWAAENGIVTGYTATGTFGPGDSITREQMAVMMYRYAAYKGYDVTKMTSLSRFPDGFAVSDYAVEAMQWIVDQGIITGDNGCLNPAGSATRVQCAAIITRFMETYKEE